MKSTFIYLFWIFILLNFSNVSAKSPKICFLKSDTFSSGTKKKDNKTYPEKWQYQIESTLQYFPELDEIKIRFVERNRNAPLATAPTFLGMFKRHRKRTYTISISNKTMIMLDSILFVNLPLCAQIGVLGHELSHVSDMKRFGFWGFMKHAFLYTFSYSYGDRFEYATDSLCIAHGLGPELFCWSLDVRKKLKSKQFFREKSKQKKRERYMNPETIEAFIERGIGKRERENMDSGGLRK